MRLRASLYAEGFYTVMQRAVGWPILDGHAYYPKNGFFGILRDRQSTCWYKRPEMKDWRRSDRVLRSTHISGERM